MRGLDVPRDAIVTGGVTAYLPDKSSKTGARNGVTA
jgi:hypothetical protein